MRIHLSPIMLASHLTNRPHSFRAHCHGQECLIASTPPTEGVDETEGWIAGLPQIRPLERTAIATGNVHRQKTIQVNIPEQLHNRNATVVGG